MPNPNIQISHVTVPYGDRYRIDVEIRGSNTQEIINGSVTQKIVSAVGKINTIRFRKDEDNWAVLDEKLDIPELQDNLSSARGKVANLTGQNKRLKEELMTYKNGQETEKDA